MDLAHPPSHRGCTTTAISDSPLLALAQTDTAYEALPTFNINTAIGKILGDGSELTSFPPIKPIEVELVKNGQPAVITITVENELGVRYCAKKTNLIRDILPPLWKKAQIQFVCPPPLPIQPSLPLEPVVPFSPKPVQEKLFLPLAGEIPFLNENGENKLLREVTSLMLRWKPDGESRNPMPVILVYGQTGLGKQTLLKTVFYKVATKLSAGSGSHTWALHITADDLKTEYGNAFSPGSPEKNKIRLNEKFDHLRFLAISGLESLSGRDLKSAAYLDRVIKSIRNRGGCVLASIAAPTKEKMEELVSRMSGNLNHTLAGFTSIPIQPAHLLTKKEMLRRLELGSKKLDEETIERLVAEDFSCSKLLAVGRECLMGVNHSATKSLSAEEAIGEIARMRGLTTAALTGGGQTRPIVLARGLTCYILARCYGLKTRDVAKLFKKKDHSGIAARARNFETLMQADPEASRLLNEAKKRLGLPQ